MNKLIVFTTNMLLLFCLSACSSTHKDLTAPCPNFGKSCSQTPINSWDYSH
jgi:hypothetical protein